MNKRGYSTLSSVIVLSCLLGLLQPVNAGWLDNVKSVGKQLVDEAIKNNATSEPKESPKQTESTLQITRESTEGNRQQPKYPPALVADIQSELNRVGYDVGIVDGAYGPGTSAAIQGFQRDQRIAVDGIPTVPLLQRLKAQSGRQASSVSNGASGMPQQSAGMSKSNQPSSVSSQHAATSTAEEDVSVSGVSSVIMPDIDVIGLRLGMTAEEATKILESKGYIEQKPSARSYGTLAYKTLIGGKVLSETKRIISSNYSKQDELKTDNIILRYPLAPNKRVVYAIDRNVSYKAKEFSPAKEKILTAIISKYGKESLSFLNDRKWFYDAKGNVIHDSMLAISAACGGYSSPNNLYELNAPQFMFGENNQANKQLLYIAEHYEKCHALLEVGIGERATKGIAISTIYNSGAYLQEASRKTLAFINEYIQRA
ncbi:MAG: peptidoglycan-binding protein [Deltaproteobacteria bacterium]|nr:peptidoglycan-binding protein [Deltaproteobacteria bacterium]